LDVDISEPTSWEHLNQFLMITHWAMQTGLLCT